MAAIQQVLMAVGSGADTTALSIYNKIVGWWERDETSGTTMVDAHTNALNGTYSGLTVNQSPLATNLGKSVTFPSGNNYAEVADNSLLKITGAFSVMVWVKRNGTQGNFPKLIWKPGGSKASGQANYLLQQDNFSAGGKVLFRYSTSAGDTTITSATALADATVYQIIGTRNGSNVNLYLNGAVSSSINSGNGGIALTATDNLRWGYHGSTGDIWIGSQDQSAVFNEELTSAEVTYLYNSGNGISYATLKAAAGF